MRSPLALDQHPLGVDDVEDDNSLSVPARMRCELRAFGLRRGLVGAGDARGGGVCGKGHSSAQEADDVVRCVRVRDNVAIEWKCNDGVTWKCNGSIPTA